MEKVTIESKSQNKNFKDIATSQSIERTIAKRKYNVFSAEKEIEDLVFAYQIVKDEKFNIIYRIVTRKGETKFVQEHGRGIFSSTGELLALEGFITEIPEKHHNVTTAVH